MINAIFVISQIALILKRHNCCTPLRQMCAGQFFITSESVNLVKRSQVAKHRLCSQQHISFVRPESYQTTAEGKLIVAVHFIYVSKDVLHALASVILMSWFYQIKPMIFYINCINYVTLITFRLSQATTHISARSIQ